MEGDDEFVCLPGRWRCTTHTPPCVFHLKTVRNWLRSHLCFDVEVTDRLSLLNCFKTAKGDRRSLVYVVEKPALHHSFFISADTFERVPEDLVGVDNSPVRILAAKAEYLRQFDADDLNASQLADILNAHNQTHTKGEGYNVSGKKELLVARVNHLRGRITGEELKLIEQGKLEKKRDLIKDTKERVRKKQGISMENLIAETFLRLRWVLSVQQCYEAADAQQQPLIVVQLVSLGNEEVVATVKDAHAKAAAIAHLPLRLFAHDAVLSTVADPWTNRERSEAAKWWVENVRTTAALLGEHSQLFVVFLQPFLNDRIVLCLIVRSKRYIPLKEKVYPSVVGGLKVLLIEGSCSNTGGASSVAVDTRFAPGYVGASFGPQSNDRSAQSSSIGGIVFDEKRNTHFAVTAGHCVKEFKSDPAGKCSDLHDVPSSRDIPFSAKLPTLHLERKTYCEQNDYGFVNVVGALPAVKCTLDVALLRAEDGLLYACTATEDERFQDALSYFQSSTVFSLRDVLSASDVKFAVFGRSCGSVKDLSLERGVLSLCHARISRRGEKASLYSTAEDALFNQLLFSTESGKCPVDEGDSGSLLWKITDKSLDAVALNIAIASEGNVSRYGVATPIEAVLWWLRNVGFEVSFVNGERDVTRMRERRNGMGDDSD